MTVIEFFDKNHIDNLASTLLFEPDKVIFVGNSTKEIKRCLKHYTNALAQMEKGESTVFKPFSAPKNDLDSVVKKLSGLIEDEGVCYFDISGGDEVYLLALGMLYQKYGSKRVQLHRYNISAGKLTDYDGNGDPVAQTDVSISTTDYVTAYGGMVKKVEFHNLEYGIWELTPERIADIRKLWKICCRDNADWNAQVQVMSRLISAKCAANSQKITFSRAFLLTVLKERSIEVTAVDSFFKELLEEGILIEYSVKGKEITITIKSPLIKSLFIKAGTLLELMISIMASELTDSDGDALYNDVSMGVVLDWDTNPDVIAETTNEIDVILMKGMLPVFISCKNGQTPIDELYKLHTVAERFGGAYVKKALIAPDLDTQSSMGKHIKDRADEMGISVLGKSHFRNDAVLSEALRTLWE